MALREVSQMSASPTIATITKTSHANAAIYFHSPQQQATQQRRVIRLVNPFESLIRFAAILEPGSLSQTLSLSPHSGVIEGRNFVRVSIEFASGKQSPQPAPSGYLDLHYWRRPRNSKLVRNIVRIEIKPEIAPPQLKAIVGADNQTPNTLQLKTETKWFIARRSIKFICIIALIVYNMLLINSGGSRLATKAQCVHTKLEP